MHPPLLVSLISILLNLKLFGTMNLEAASPCNARRRGIHGRRQIRWVSLYTGYPGEMCSKGGCDTVIL